jgi:hypothetical protein
MIVADKPSIRTDSHKYIYLLVLVAVLVVPALTIYFLTTKKMRNSKKSMLSKGN